ncbi:TetR/AcrR family transcriptional regulator [Pseudonocardia sp. 73-21]|mgnify:CR=1 FL=1|jgi:AcrR family transcriptional regulator|uniref:TetR/AcrR family transcriptional regulator n=1 Tax=Pseudonocardia sp. 73-21 TaxID=1895809 RepID=UPI00095F665B|nr:TetR/AcrR family transcriptional regulator [Pseudonocardia sp. 73-21]OJY52976.1 MAG: TetR family transcriptional regulator [Pseudonocardia sp. 73-21]
MSEPTTRADAQRARVLATSVEIFGTRGYRATSMNEIAAGVGLSKPTLYHYFRNKEELLVRIYSDVLDESLRMARATVAAAPTPLDGLRELLVSRVVYTCENRELLKICFEEEDELRPDLAEELLVRRRAFEDVAVDALCGHLAAHPQMHLTMAPKVFVNLCLGAVNWTYKWYRPTGPRTPQELGREMADALLMAVTP